MALRTSLYAAACAEVFLALTFYWIGGVRVHTFEYFACNVDICSSCLLSDFSLNPHTLLHALSTVKKFWGGDGILGLLSVHPMWTQIRDSQLYSSEDEKRMAVLHYSLQTVPGVSWGKIAGVLWYMEEHTALETVRQYLPHKPGDYI